MNYDVVIVGGGPAGLSTAIRLKQLEKKYNKDISVCLIDKGSQIGANILSGNCFDPTYFNELFPEWQKMENRPPINQEVKEDKVLFLLNEQNSLTVPQDLMLNAHKNHGNYIISLSELCKWMGDQAQELGVDIFSGFAGKDILFDDQKRVIGVLSNEFGVDKNGNKKENYQDGIELIGRQTVIGEGCRGSLAMKLIEKYNLDKDSDPMTFGIGLKEVWEVKSSKHYAGLVQHSIGWPLDKCTYGGSFMYHMENNLVSIGMVIGLDYKNPYLNPYEEFQRFKTHPSIKHFLEEGQCISYGARALNEGSYFALPQLTFPGGMLVGCAASTLNVMQIKGAHYAIGTGILAADNLYQHLILSSSSSQSPIQIHSYQTQFNNSHMHKQLYNQRNFKNAFKKGFYFGLLHSAFIDKISKGKENWNFRNKIKDSQTTQIKSNFEPIQYPKHDGKITFDLLDNLARSGTNHEHDQPSHLVIKKYKHNIPLESYKKYGAPEERFCPAKVYEFVVEENRQTKKEEVRLQINAQNCLHCKTCSIKMVEEYIDWTVPEGGGGPNYTLM